jgi:hypothetical protein
MHLKILVSKQPKHSIFVVLTDVSDEYVTTGLIIGNVLQNNILVFREIMF